ncbi:MAG TPA: cyclic pyranopterin monophosphate synthase MoaC [Candidatus Lumbricidophila sp.]|nr:cyclic pyranopterin monophosphate synthase MoaC [Candidatus Lumbricidophila sp.]
MTTQPGELSHIRGDGSAHMVDVSQKAVTKRIASAQAIVITRPEVVAMVSDGTLPKGEALSTARIAGILAAKQTPTLIPLCHPLPISNVSIDIDPQGDRLRVVATVATTGVTGVEMEALTAASITALTLFDMLKAVDHEAMITDVFVLTKSGGKSGDWVRS